jgi:hypothetical protein
LVAIACWPAVLGGATGSVWTIETVDASGTGKYSSLRIDKDGNAHLAYVLDDGSHALKYAYWDRMQHKWYTMTVATGASFCSLALDSQQRPHVSYNDYGTASGSRLRYAHWTGSEWMVQAVPLDSDVIAYYTSIVLDAVDQPMISFYEYRGRKDTNIRIRLRVVNRNGNQWEVRTVDPDEGSGKFNSMALDPKGHVILAYANVDALRTSARIALWDGKVWDSRQIDMTIQQNVLGYSMGLALDLEGNPHMSYWDISVPLVKYASVQNGRVLIEVVDSDRLPAYWDRNAIALAPDGQPYTSYYDARRGELRLAHKEGRAWKVEVVDSGYAGFTSSLQIDRDTIWIAYADEGQQSLKVARRDLRPIVPVDVQAPPRTPAAKQ